MSELIKSKEVEKILKISRSKAYKIIKKLNDELMKEGYEVISGRIPKDYLLERFKLNKEK